MKNRKTWNDLWVELIETQKASAELVKSNMDLRDRIEELEKECDQARHDLETLKVVLSDNTFARIAGSGGIQEYRQAIQQFCGYIDDEYEAPDPPKGKRGGEEAR